MQKIIFCGIFLIFISVPLVMLVLIATVYAGFTYHSPVLAYKAGYICWAFSDRILATLNCPVLFFRFDFHLVTNH